MRLPKEGGETENLEGPACLKQEKGKIALAPPGWVSQRGKLGQGTAQDYLASQWRARNKTAQLWIFCSSCQETILLCPEGEFCQRTGHATHNSSLTVDTGYAKQNKGM